jgi:exodeoxyribonuclease VII large subunit
VTRADCAAEGGAPPPSAAAELVVPDRLEAVAALRQLGGRSAAAAGRAAAGARRDLDAERRALDRLEPRARLAASRERAGLLLDRATRGVGERLARGSREVGMASGRLAPILPRRLDADRSRLGALGTRAPASVDARLRAAASGLAAASASLTALAPAATLGRGYAIVRRASDRAILRDPGDAPAGSALELTLARGTLAATSDGPPGAGRARIEPEQPKEP